MEQLSPEILQPNSDILLNWKRFFKDLLETVILAIVLFLAINTISARVGVHGYSMLPTLDDGAYVLVNRIAYRFGAFQRGDIIVFRPPMYPKQSLFWKITGLPGEEEDYIKRIIGLPGEIVGIENGQVYINDIPLQESFISGPPQYSGVWQVPENCLFVLGDNRNDSSDSHSWGMLPTENVLGKAVLVYWPFSDWMVIDDHIGVLAAP